MQNQPQHINFKSDFILRERFADDLGRAIPDPGLDFELSYWVKPGHTTYTASRRNGHYLNCKPDPDNESILLVVFHNHGLCEGPLKREYRFMLPNPLMPDAIQKQAGFLPLDVELWPFPSDPGNPAESSLIMPLLKGDKGDPWSPETASPQEIDRIVHGLLESEAPLLGEILDRVNSTFDAILGPGGATPGVPGAAAAAPNSPTAPRYLQRGIISIYARSGVVYRNYGQIRLPGKRRIFDLSGIPSIQSVSASIRRVERPDLVKYDSEAKTVEILEDENGKRPNEVRVNIYEPNEGEYYIMKSEDGSIRTFHKSSFPVVDRPLEAPIVPRGSYAGCSSLQDVLDALPLTHRIEVQRKRRQYLKPLREGLRKSSAWHKRHRITRYYEGNTSKGVVDDVNGIYIDYVGVFRIRYIDNKSRKSAWTVFSLRVRGDCAFVAPL